MDSSRVDAGINQSVAPTMPKGSIGNTMADERHGIEGMRGFDANSIAT
jgi:hypothetical protein